MFNPNFKPRADLAQTYGNNYAPEQGTGDVSLNYAGAFGIPGLTAAVKNNSGFKLYRGLDQDREKAYANVRGDQVQMGQWQADPTVSDAQMLRDAAMTFGAAYGGLNAMGALGGAGASGAGFIGEGVGSGVPAWDGAMGGSMLEAGGATGASGGLFGGAKELLGKVPPRAVTSLLGGVMGTQGQPTPGAYSGPMPTITRGGWKPSVTPNYMSLFDVSSLLRGA